MIMSVACLQFSDWIIQRLKKIGIAIGRGALFVPSLLIGPVPSSWQHFTPAQVRGGHNRYNPSGVTRGIHLQPEMWARDIQPQAEVWARVIQPHAEVWAPGILFQSEVYCTWCTATPGSILARSTQLHPEVLARGVQLHPAVYWHVVHSYTRKY